MAQITDRMIIEEEVSEEIYNRLQSVLTDKIMNKLEKKLMGLYVSVDKSDYDDILADEISTALAEKMRNRG